MLKYMLKGATKKGNPLFSLYFFILFELIIGLYQSIDRKDTFKYRQRLQHLKPFL